MPARRRIPAAVAIACALSVPMPGPRRSSDEPARRSTVVADNARCESCHVEIAAEWRSSFHHLAHTDPVYRRALAREPLPFCRGCHSPEADPSRDPPKALGDLGIGCVTCHRAADGVLGRDPPDPGASTAPHRLTRSSAFASAAACAGCHEFAFPDSSERTPRVRTLMQSTSSEHAASSFAGASCASCHMPATGSAGGRSHRSHSFSSVRDPAVLRAAIVVRAARLPGDVVELRLSSAGVGHAFPTGDLFRRLELSAEAVGPDQNTITEGARHLARRFGMERRPNGRTVKVMVADSRVQPGIETLIQVPLGGAAGGFPIAWRVSYQRVEHPIGADGDAAVVEADIELARGVLPP